MNNATETRYLLERMSDAGQFELLATEVLRAADKRYAGLSHPGINSECKPVPSPVDGITVNYDEVSQTLVLAAHTITSKSKLRGKWLSEKDSDCNKALEIIVSETKRESFQKANIVLTCNCEPSEKLFRDVHARATNNLSLDVWTVSRIASFLDNDPEGQWIRSKFFGKVAQRISASLLQRICAVSVEQNCPHFDRTSSVARSFDRTLEDFAKSQRGTGFVFGESGQGKSVACWQLARKMIAQGHPVLYISHDTIERFSTLAQALTIELQSIEPGLDNNCGGAALALGRAQNSLLLIVEDANEAANPEK